MWVKTLGSFSGFHNTTHSWLTSLSLTLALSLFVNSLFFLNSKFGILKGEALGHLFFSFSIYTSSLGDQFSFSGFIMSVCRWVPNLHIQHYPFLECQTCIFIWMSHRHLKWASPKENSHFSLLNLCLSHLSYLKSILVYPVAQTRSKGHF